VAGCSEDSGFDAPENRPPDTFISYGPSEEACNYYKVTAMWYGNDDDGSVTRFEIAVVKGLRSEFLQNPDYDAMPWYVTTATDSTFVLEADSCCGLQGDDWYELAYWGILVRAIDNEWARDPEPATLFFHACNVIPQVRLSIPDADVIHALPPPVGLCSRLYIEWQGLDPDGDQANLVYKYLVIPEADIAGGAWEPGPGTPQPWLPPLDHDSTGVGGSAPPIGYWSKWVPADCTYVRYLDLSEYSGTADPLLVFVTVKDEASAILPEQLFGNLYNNRGNWIKFIVDGGPGVPIVLDMGMMGQYRSTGPACQEQRIVYLFSGTEVKFSFWGEEEKDRGIIAGAYRYYFDDPENPSTSTWDRWTPVDPLREAGQVPEWYVTFPGDGTSILPTMGAHIFETELRDYCGVTSGCKLNLVVLANAHAALEPLIYLVDDNVDDGLELEPPWREQSEDSLWAAILDGYEHEVFDTGSDFANEVNPRNLSRATTLIWAVDEAQHDEPQLLRVCTEYGNYLHSYVKTGGNLIIIGRNPVYACAYWPDWKTRRTPNPDFRSTLVDLDFSPQSSYISDADTVVNFNWDVFGIERMLMGIPGEFSFTTFTPCEGGWSPVAARTISDHPGWGEIFDRELFITQVRDDIEVHTLYGTIPLDDQGQPQDPDCSKWLAVYVPGDETRGHAAYVSIPPYLCDPDQVKAMVRHLLDLFGEPRQ
jgi:hypothetical protein